MARALGRAVVRYAACLVAASIVAALLVAIAPGIGMDERRLDVQFGDAEPSVLQPKHPGEIWLGWVTGLPRGDFGHSTAFDRPVSSLLSERFGVTAFNVAVALSVSWALGLGIALARFWTLFSWTRYLAAPIAGSLLCLPAGLIAFAAMASGCGAPTAISCVLLPRIWRYADSILSEAAAMPCVLAATAAGMTERQITAGYIFRNAVPQLVGTAAVTVALAFGAAIPAEVLCDAPGLGQLAWRAALARDTQLVVTVAMIITAGTLLLCQASDLLRASTGERAA